MKVINKRSLTITFLFLVTLFLLPVTIRTTSGLNERNPAVYEMTFLHAEYLDADMDGLEDDTRFSVLVFFNPEFFDGSVVKLDCLFEIILPSNATFTFKGYIRLESLDCIIQFDVYNTVTEPGWYTINFSSSVRLFNIRYTCYCTIIFDPPTGGGEGDGGGPEVFLSRTICG
ncbi:MAG: hypothetical protein ACTSSH_06095 [Candidatus Heimdallarchaeota archaeon]